jgi:hypothetical protein
MANANHRSYHLTLQRPRTRRTSLTHLLHVPTPVFLSLTQRLELPLDIVLSYQSTLTLELLTPLQVASS